MSRRRTGHGRSTIAPADQAAVEDAFGNVITSDTSTVTIAVASGPGGFTDRKHDQRRGRRRSGHVR